MRRNFDGGKMNLELLMGLNVFTHPNLEGVLGMLSCLHVCTVVSLAPQRQIGFYSYSISDSLSIISWCPVNTGIPSPKILALQMGVKPQNCGFF
jgi:hypothetical protein